MIYILAVVFAIPLALLGGIWNSWWLVAIYNQLVTDLFVALPVLTTLQFYALMILLTGMKGFKRVKSSDNESGLSQIIADITLLVLSGPISYLLFLIIY